jgi:GNAT superfamily N-acetyltransferase
VSVVIRPSRNEEAARLKQIAIASKAHWGYPLQQVREWASHGDFTPERLQELVVFVAEDAGQAVGWCSLVPRGAVCWLEDLWVEPKSIGRGVGTQLFSHAVRYAAAEGAERLEWEAEPNAVGFYERLGGVYLRESPTTEWGRRLPIMGRALDC